MILDATLKNLHKVLSYVDDELEKLNCPLKAKLQIDIAVEEVFVNIASYAYVHGIGKATVMIVPERDPTGISIVFKDSGIPYNPLEKPDPDVTLPAMDRQIGGLGIFMVKKSMDEMTYRYENGQNILTIRKFF